MKNTYIPFNLNKTESYTLYYDYAAKQFFKSRNGRQSSMLATLSGTIGVILYAKFKNHQVMIGGGDPLKTLLFSFFIGCFLAIVVLCLETETE